MNERIRRPVVFLAYGEHGLEWLERTASRYPHISPVLGEMMQARVIQFWCVGLETVAEPASPVDIISSAVDALAVKERLHLARADRYRAQFGLDLTGPVLVVERWSMFRRGWESRTKLREAFSLARFVDCDPQAAPEMEYQWISLVDAVRSSSPVDERVVRQIREALGPETIHDVPLLIDRTTEGSGIVDDDAADRCFHQLAVSLLTSDLAFPPPDAGDQRRSAVLAHDVDKGRVYPLSVVSLIHSESDIRRICADSVHVSLTQGPLSTDLLRSQPTQPTLDSLAVAEADAIRNGTFSLRTARERRDECAAQLIRTAILQRDPGPAMDEVARARRAVQFHLPSELTPAPTMTGVALLLQGEMGEFGLWIGGLLLMAGIGAVVWWNRRRPKAHVATPDSRPDPNLLEARRQWTALLDATEAVLLEVRELFASGRREEPVTGALMWKPVAEHPYDWRLSHSTAVPLQLQPLDKNAYDRIARSLLRRTREGHSAAGALADVMQSEADAILHRSEAVRNAILTAALTEPNVRPLRAALQQVRLLAHTGTPIRIAEVLWLVHPDLRIESELAAIDGARRDHPLRFLASEDLNRTVRVAFGSSVSWSDVLSLENFLKPL